MSRSGLMAWVVVLGVVALLTTGCDGPGTTGAGDTVDTAGTLVFCGTAPDDEGRPAKAVFSIRADGTGRRKITEADRIEAPSVSPIGRKLVYFRWPRLYVCNWDGSDVVDVTPMGREHFLPEWSPDGKTIALTSDRTNDGEIFLMNPDGSDPRNITRRSLSTEMNPTWSPDGRHLAFISDRSGTRSVFIMDKHGRNQHAVTDGSLECHAPHWSPRGDRIAFCGQRDGNFDVYLVNVDGTGLTRLTTDTAWDGHPAFSPDGRRLAFVSNRSGSSDIWLMDLDTRKLVNLTDSPDQDETFPAWVPRQVADQPLEITESGYGQTTLGRPRLLMNAKDLPALQEKLKHEPYATAWKAFLKKCDSYVGDDSNAMAKLVKRLPTIQKSPRNTTPPFEVARDLGFAYLVTGKDEYGQAGAKLLEQTCRLIQKHHPLFAGSWRWGPAELLPCAFDWLYEAFTDEQRNLVRAVLLGWTDRAYSRAVQSSMGMAPSAERAPTSSNITYIISGYLGPPALALAGEPGYQPQWLNGAVHMAQNVVERWFDDNGCPHCGHSYFRWAGEMALPFVVSCVENNLGNNLAGQNIRHWPKWMTMTSRDGFSRTLDMGDSNASSPRFHVAYLHLYPDNPLVDMLWTRTDSRTEPQPTIEDLLWWRPVKPQPDALSTMPRGVFFPNGGFMVLRSGFDTNDSMLTFSAPRFGGHSHAEGGAICLYGMGTEFLVEAGNGNPKPHAHNNVLVNGRGRPHPWPDPGHDLLTPGTPAPLGVPARADLVPVFSTVKDGHGDYSYISPGYPLKEATRHALIIDADDGVPPYYVVADDVNRNDTVNRYGFLMTGQRDSVMTPGDHKLTIRPAYRGRWFESAGSDRDDAVTFDIAVPRTARYRIWIYVKDPKSAYHLTLGDQKINGWASADATRTHCWQWQPFLAGPRGKQAPAEVDLKKGAPQLSLHHATERYGGNFARVLLTPSDEYEPWLPEAEDAPAGSVLVTAEQARSVGKAWTAHPAKPASTEPRATLYFLNDRPIEFEQTTYTYRTRHFGQDLVRLPRVTAVRKVVNPRFLVLAWTHRADATEPVVERLRMHNRPAARIRWPGATDLVQWPTPGRPVVVRTYDDGRTLQLGSARPDQANQSKD